MPTLKGRSFINTLEFKPAELEYLLDRAKAIKTFGDMIDVVQSLTAAS